MDSFPFKLGLQPGRVPVGLGSLTDYVAGRLPTAPSKCGLPGVSAWGMLGNDRCGDCGVAGLEHGFMADAMVADEREDFPTAAQAVAYYLTYTGGADRGVVLCDFLSYVRSHGYYDHTVRAYAPVPASDTRTLRSAVWLYGFAYAGIRVTAAMQQAFQQGQPWVQDLLLSQVVGGHCVPVVSYDEHWAYVVTWGRVQRVSWPMWQAIRTEAWAVLTGELVARHGDGRGVSLAALEQDLDALEAA